MSFKTPKDTATNKYYDDFDDNKNFVQILFNPGKPVQARELTQLQSILQNQISKFSDHVFADGAIVFGCKVNLLKYGFLRVKKNTIKDAVGEIIDEDFTSDAVCRTWFFKKPTDSAGIVINDNIKIGTTFVPITSNLYANRTLIKDLDDDFQIEIVDVIPETDTDDLILVYKFTKGSVSHIKNFTGLTLKEVSKNPNFGVDPNLFAIDLGIVNTNPITFEIIDAIYINSSTTPENILVENVNDIYLVNVTSGIVYKDGKFVNVAEKSIILNTLSELSGNLITTEYTLSIMWRNIGSITKTINQGTIGNGRKLFSYPYKSVGFLFNYVYVNHIGDVSLGDNARGFTNYSAPGADRLKFDISITQNDVDISNPIFPDNYIEIIRIRGGIIDIIKTNVEKQYSEILKLFAKRTYDESGSYTVRPFLLDIKEHLRITYFKIKFTGLTGTLSPVPEIGDLIFPQNENTSNELTNYLIFNSNEKTSNYKYGVDYPNKHIGEIVSFGSDYIIIKQLSKLSWTSVNASSTIQRKSPDTEVGTGIVSTFSGSTLGIPEFLDGNNGVYTTFDMPIGNSDKYIISANGGRAYVQGFEYETSNVNNIECNKARGDDHLQISNSRIDTKLENGLIVNAGDDLFTSSGYESSLIDINFNGITMKFLSTTEGLATGTIQEWAPFRNGISVNMNTNGYLVSANNKESVIFITSENAPT